MNVLEDNLDLVVGDEQTIALPGLGTAGYMWQERVIGPPDVIAISWSRGFAPGIEPAAIGVSAPERITIRGVRPGEAQLRLIQVRHWEPDEAPINGLKRRITVTRRQSRRLEPDPDLADSG
jgi:predicted secreted protein